MVQAKDRVKRSFWKVYIASITLYAVWITSGRHHFFTDIVTGEKKTAASVTKSIHARWPLEVNASRIGTTTTLGTTRTTTTIPKDLAVQVQEPIAEPLYSYTFTMRSQTAQTKYYVSDEKLSKTIANKCSHKYDTAKELPTASIIITFYKGEKLDHLLHTLHSIMVNSPRQLVHEIILIADNTKMEAHQLPLERYVNFHFPGVVKILRSQKQLGLVQGRLLGARAATGDVIIIMDSHCEVQPHWLEALLYEIKKDPKTMVTPMLDWMKPGPNGTWTYEFGSSRCKTVFYWNLYFTFMDIPAPDKIGQADPTEPLQSPTTVGTCWAMDREYFKTIGELDEKMLMWGGENIDLALRAVLFGGKHVNVPCSHVSHLEEPGMRDYRGNFDPSINFLRATESWFDNYKDIFLLYHPHLKGKDFGDISDRLYLKKKALHNFEYFHKNFYPELGTPGFGTFAWGQLNNLGAMKLRNDDLCLTSWWDQPLKMEPCFNTPTDNKILMWDYGGEFRGALMAHVVDPDGRIMAHGKPNFYGLPNRQRWIHWKGGPLIPYPSRRTMCLETVIKDETFSLQLANCNISKPTQQWKFQYYDNSYELLEQGKYRPPSDSSEEVKNYFYYYSTTYGAVKGPR